MVQPSQKPLLPFTVISMDEASGHIYSNHVQAETALTAFSAAALERTHSVSFLVAFPFHAELEYAGDEGGGLDRTSLLELPSVFGIAGREITPNEALM